MRRVIFGLLFGGYALVGCAAPAEKYVEADRATFESVAPKFLRYVRADEELDEVEREVRELVIETWRARIEAAEKELVEDDK